MERGTPRNKKIYNSEWGQKTNKITQQKNASVTLKLKYPNVNIGFKELLK